MSNGVLNLMFRCPLFQLVLLFVLKLLTPIETCPSTSTHPTVRKPTTPFTHLIFTRHRHIEHNSLTLQPLHQPIPPALPPNSTLLHAAKRRVQRPAIRSINRHSPGLQQSTHAHRPRDIARIDRRREAVRSIIRHLNRLFFRLESLDAENRAENLVGVDAGLVVRVQLDRGLDEVALLSLPGASGQDFGAGRLA